jgi:hypothetical protein
LDNHLAFVQTVSFPRQYFFHASPRTRTDVSFVYFDRSRDSVPATIAPCQRNDQRRHRCAANVAADPFSTNQLAR